MSLMYRRALGLVFDICAVSRNTASPCGVSATNVQFRQATFIETSIGNVQRVLLEAAVVVAIVLFVFLVNVRATAISLAAIPISILITVLVFRAFDLTINTMTLGGLAIALQINAA